jgi:capsular exopolysaccharide synthesis family protein
MSRIDDALKRAAGDDVPLRERTDSMSQAARRDEESSLERYPREGRAPIEKPTRSELSSSRPIAAPRTGGRGQLAPTRTELEGKLVISGQTVPMAVEQYRRLGATLHQLQTERGLKMLLVTSTVPEEGKTLTVANLALTLSESYKRRVLLIDADLRRPSIHEVFGLPNLTGLTDVLRVERGQLPVLEVSPHLSIVPAGHPDANPMAKLTSARMQALLEEASAAFDWVLLDAPPVGLIPDANLLARLTNAVLFVIAAGLTPHTLVERAISDIGRDYLIGTVLNRVDDRSLPSVGYYGNYYGAGPAK